MTHSFEDLHELHNGAYYLTPTDLATTKSKPKRVLIVGSCLAYVWQTQIDCPCDFVMTNGLGLLPECPPQPINEYDLQLIQIPLRFVAQEDELWKQSFLDLPAYESVFEIAQQRIKQYLSTACRWNSEHGLLTFVANFLVPQQNPIGRFAPRYDLRNPVYFVEQLNFALSKEIASYKNAYLLDIDSISSVFGKKNIQDDSVEIQMHGSVLGNSGYERDQDRIEPIKCMTEHYELFRDGFIAAIWHQAAAMYKTLHLEDAVKLVIFDLDNTLWRGIVAEEGEIDSLTIEGWPLGLVEALVFLKRRGTLLAIASKNDERRIRELWPLIMHGRLALEDFAVIKINWQSKPESVDEILRFAHTSSPHSFY